MHPQGRYADVLNYLIGFILLKFKTRQRRILMADV